VHARIKLICLFGSLIKRGFKDHSFDLSKTFVFENTYWLSLIVHFNETNVFFIQSPIIGRSSSENQFYIGIRK
jgi:hypothetical protein